MIVVLSSGVALGVHVPGVLLAHRLAERGIGARVDVIERLLPADARQRIGRSKALFRRDVRAAIAGQRLLRDLRPLLDEHAVRRLLDAWHGEAVDTFVVMSGLWLPLVERFLDECRGARPRVDLCHVDSCPSPSWRLAGAGDGRLGHRQVWLLDAATGTIPCTIPVSTEDPLPWSAREPRAISHGGGWGMGTYRDASRVLAERGVALDVVVHDPADADAVAGPRTRLFLIDPTWEPWHDDGFPPFGRLLPDRSVTYGRDEHHHDAFHLTRRASAIVSKPGGGTLLDSLWSATPVVLLDPVGAHEAANARLWEQLGFGVGYERWLDGGASLDALEPLHRNLLVARPRVPSLADALAGVGR